MRTGQPQGVAPTSPNLFLRSLRPLMKMPTRGKNPPVLRPAPFGKGGHWGIFRLCFERGAAHFHLLCCTDWYMNYFAVNIPNPNLQRLEKPHHPSAQPVVDTISCAAFDGEVDRRDQKHQVVAQADFMGMIRLSVE